MIRTNQKPQNILKRNDAFELAVLVDAVHAVRLARVELVQQRLDGVRFGAREVLQRRGAQLADERAEGLAEGGHGVFSAGEGEDVGLGVHLDDGAVLVEHRQRGDLAQRQGVEGVDERRVHAHEDEVAEGADAVLSDGQLQQLDLDGGEQVRDEPAHDHAVRQDGEDRVVLGADHRHPVNLVRQQLPDHVQAGRFRRAADQPRRTVGGQRLAHLFQREPFDLSQTRTRSRRSIIIIIIIIIMSSSRSR